MRKFKVYEYNKSKESKQVEGTFMQDAVKAFVLVDHKCPNRLHLVCTHISKRTTHYVDTATGKEYRASAVSVI